MLQVSKISREPLYILAINFDVIMWKPARSNLLKLFIFS